MNPVHNNSIPATPPNLLPQSTEQVQSGPSFKTFLLDSIKEVNSMQQEADRAVEHLAAGGEDITPAEVLTAVQKADIAFRMMVQIRNKMVQAYQEVQNIRI
ncbi:MAG: flagellar hook-basal body complex protein FliE [Rhodopirellula sp.]|nr:flagellar hook-basal body complex protein FliE [Rhodopirellula sp.]